MNLDITLRNSVLLSAFVLSACGGGSGGGASPATPPVVTDTTAPVVSFSPTTLTVGSEQSGTSVLTATDNTAVTSGPSVTCTNGGAFSNDEFAAPAVTERTTSVCTATATDAAGNSGEATLTITISAPVEFNPQRGISLPSVFNENDVLNKNIGMTLNSDGGYRVHWADNLIGSQVPVSYQDYLDDGTKVDAQVDGEFQSNTSAAVAAELVLLSDDTYFHVNVNRDSFDSGINYATYRGEVSGSVFDSGDIFNSTSNRFGTGYIDPVAIPEEAKIFSAYMDQSAESEDSIQAFIVNADGTFVNMRLDDGNSNTKRIVENLALADGTLLAVWNELPGDGTNQIYLQSLSLNGDLIGGPVLLESESVIQYPTIANLTNGNLFVVWSEVGGSNQNNPNFQSGRVFGIDGLPVTTKFSISESEPNRNRPTLVHLTPLPTNQMMITNSLGSPVTSNIEILAFNADGSTAATPIQIDTELVDEAIDVRSLVFDDARVVLSWNSQAFEEESYIVNFYPVGVLE